MTAPAPRPPRECRLQPGPLSPSRAELRHREARSHCRQACGRGRGLDDSHPRAPACPEGRVPERAAGRGCFLAPVRRDRRPRPRGQQSDGTGQPPAAPPARQRVRPAPGRCEAGAAAALGQQSGPPSSKTRTGLGSGSKTKGQRGHSRASAGVTCLRVGCQAPSRQVLSQRPAGSPRPGRRGTKATSDRIRPKSLLLPPPSALWAHTWPQALGQHSSALSFSF